ncbi:MAG: hypothetical protein EZS28_027813, partial [Streblomastix strix]
QQQQVQVQQVQEQVTVGGGMGGSSMSIEEYYRDGCGLDGEYPPMTPSQFSFAYQASQQQNKNIQPISVQQLAKVTIPQGVSKRIWLGWRVYRPFQIREDAVDDEDEVDDYIEESIKRRKQHNIDVKKAAIQAARASRIQKELRKQKKQQRKLNKQQQQQDGEDNEQESSSGDDEEDISFALEIDNKDEDIKERENNEDEEDEDNEEGKKKKVEIAPIQIMKNELDVRLKHLKRLVTIHCPDLNFPEILLNKSDKEEGKGKGTLKRKKKGKKSNIEFDDQDEEDEFAILEGMKKKKKKKKKQTKLMKKGNNSMEESNENIKEGEQQEQEQQKEDNQQEQEQEDKEIDLDELDKRESVRFIRRISNSQKYKEKYPTKQTRIILSRTPFIGFRLSDIEQVWVFDPTLSFQPSIKPDPILKSSQLSSLLSTSSIYSSQLDERQGALQGSNVEGQGSQGTITQQGGQPIRYNNDVVFHSNFIRGLKYYDGGPRFYPVINQSSSSSSSSSSLSSSLSSTINQQQQNPIFDNLEIRFQLSLPPIRNITDSILPVYLRPSWPISALINECIKEDKLELIRAQPKKEKPKKKKDIKTVEIEEITEEPKMDIKKVQFEIRRLDSPPPISNHGDNYKQIPVPPQLIQSFPPQPIRIDERNDYRCSLFNILFRSFIPASLTSPQTHYLDFPQSPIFTFQFYTLPRYWSEGGLLEKVDIKMNNDNTDYDKITNSVITNSINSAIQSKNQQVDEDDEESEEESDSDLDQIITPFERQRRQRIRRSKYGMEHIIYTRLHKAMECTFHIAHNLLYYPPSSLFRSPSSFSSQYSSYSSRTDILNPSYSSKDKEFHLHSIPH